MTVATTVRKAGPTPGNSAATVFPFAFKVFAQTDLQVILTVIATGAYSVLGLNDPAGYTVSLNADQNANPGGSVTYNPSGVPLPATHELTILSVVPKLQGTHIINGGAFFANNIEDALDRAVVNIQDMNASLSGVVRFPQADSAALSAELPVAAERASMTLAFDNLGNVIAGQPSSVVISTPMIPVVQAVSLAVARSTMGVVSLTGNESIAGVKTFNDTTQSSNASTGGALFLGGVGIAKNASVGGNMTVGGGGNIAGSLVVGANSSITGNMTIGGYRTNSGAVAASAAKAVVGTNVTSIAATVTTAAGYRMAMLRITASSIKSDSSNPCAAWWLVRARTLDANAIAVATSDSGGDTGSFALSVTGNSGTGTQIITAQVTGPAGNDVINLEVDVVNALGVLSMV